MSYPDGIDADCSDRSAQVIQNFSGKHVAAVAICAAICGLCAAISWWAVQENIKTALRYRDDSIDMQMQYEKERNHVIELEARQKFLADQLQELSHVRR